MRNTIAKITFIILTFYVTFINNSYVDSWIKTTASGLSYELGVNGEKKLMETGVLIKMDVAYFTLLPRN